MDEIANNIDPIWTRIENLMKSRGLNQKEFAAKMRVTPTTVTDWKTGKSKSYQRIILMRDIANILGTTPEYLLGKSDEKSPPTPAATPTPSPAPFAAGESELLDYYRHFTREGQGRLLDFAESMKRSGMYEPGVDYFLKGFNSEGY
ncbi:MAG: helix-turn-helix transcriptional regulator [Oscillibacter sp.]|nr:helix-turn-helix transcriptional regulator [Oscillibacter sp.]